MNWLDTIHVRLIHKGLFYGFGIKHSKNDPGTIAVVALAAGTGLQAYSSYEQGKSREAIFKYNEQVKRNEARQQEYLTARKRANIEKEGRRLRASQMAAYAKSGVQFTGTPIEVMAESAAAFKEDELMAQYEGDAVRRNLLQEADISEYRADSARRAGRLGVGESLFSGTAQTLAMRHRMKES
jgi:hypothetical protein